MFLSKLHNNGAGSEFLPETNFDKKNFPGKKMMNGSRNSQNSKRDRI
jgi:hypothetical protein